MIASPVTTKSRLHLVGKESDLIEIAGRPRPRIEPGDYEARLLGWDTVRMQQFGGSSKVFLEFEIVCGEYADTRLFAAYRVKAINGKSKRRGGFTLGRGSELLRQLGILGLLTRPDRLSLEPLRKVILQVRVRTVARNAKGRPLPEELRYSVVDEMLNVQAGSLEQ